MIRLTPIAAALSLVFASQLAAAATHDRMVREHGCRQKTAIAAVATAATRVRPCAACQH